MTEKYLRDAMTAAANNNYEEANKFIMKYYTALALEKVWEEMERQEEIEEMKMIVSLNKLLRGIKLDSYEENLIKKFQSLDV